MIPHDDFFLHDFHLLNWRRSTDTWQTWLAVSACDACLQTDCAPTSCSFAADSARVSRSRKTFSTFRPPLRLAPLMSLHHRRTQVSSKMFSRNSSALRLRSAIRLVRRQQQLMRYRQQRSITIRVSQVESLTNATPPACIKYYQKRNFSAAPTGGRDVDVTTKFGDSSFWEEQYSSQVRAWDRRHYSLPVHLLDVDPLFILSSSFPSFNFLLFEELSVVQ